MIQTRKDSSLQLECDGRPHLTSVGLAGDAAAVELPANRTQIPRIELGNSEDIQYQVLWNLVKRWSPHGFAKMA